MLNLYHSRAAELGALGFLLISLRLSTYFQLPIVDDYILYEKISKISNFSDLTQKLSFPFTVIEYIAFSIIRKMLLSRLPWPETVTYRPHAQELTLASFILVISTLARSIFSRITR